MKWKNGLILILVSSLITVLKAQDTHLLPKIFQNTPNSASIEKFGTYQVNTFTGLPDISIPLYEIKAGELSVPITLRYHASGNRVDDIASLVGLGWALETGGSVNRKVRGLADEDSEFSYLNGYSTVDPDPDSWAGEDYLYNVREGFKDSEPDIFSYNFPGKSGRFFFNGADAFNIVQIPYSPVKISETFVDDDLTFDILDEKGNYYQFGQNQAIESTSNGREGSTTGWMLNKMISQSRRDTVLFTYSRDLQVELPCQTSFSVVVYDEVTSFGTENYSPNPGTTTTGRDYCATITEQRVSEIKFNGGKVVFTHTSRTDRTFSPKLSTIEIYNYDHLTLTYALQKSIDFYYSYFDLNGKLKLDSLSIIDNSDSEIEKYRFVYNTTIDLPEIGSEESFGQDYWGYYNGKENINLLPEITFLYNEYGLGDTPVTICTGNSRESDSLYAQADILTQVYYPTGGHTEFEYQSNRYKDTQEQTVLAGGLRIKSVKSYDNLSPNPVIHTYFYGDGRLNSTIDNSFYCTTQTRRWISEAAITETVRQRVFTSNPVNDIIPFDGSIVVYPKVTEFIGTASANTGKIEYIYTDRGDGTNTTYASSKPRTDSYFYSRGQLASKAYFKLVGSNYFPVKRESYGYDVISFPDTWFEDVGFIAERIIINDCSGVSDYPIHYVENNSGPSDIESYNYQFYPIKSDDNYLTSKQEKTYDQNDTTIYMLTTTNYEYDNFIHQQVSKTTTTDSKGNTIISYSKYAADYIPENEEETGNEELDSMLSKNMQAYSIEQYTKIEGNTTKAQLNKFEIGAMGAILPESVEVLEISAPVTDFDTCKIVSQELDTDSRYHTYINYDDYDGFNNITEYTVRNSPTVSLIWGYNSNYPIAKVTNSTDLQIAYSSFETKVDTGRWIYSGNPSYNSVAQTGKGYYLLSNGSITKSILEVGKYRLQYWAKDAVTITGGTVTSVYTSSANENGWTYYEKEINITTNPTTVTISGSTSIDELRLFPVGSQMITYTYEPQLGITSQTDENNSTTYYEYDNYGRLKYVKDNDRNILKRYDYNYQTSEY